jgi:hypothetical protein
MMHRIVLTALVVILAGCKNVQQPASPPETPARTFTRATISVSGFTAAHHHQSSLSDLQNHSSREWKDTLALAFNDSVACDSAHAPKSDADTITIASHDYVSYGSSDRSLQLVRDPARNVFSALSYSYNMTSEPSILAGNRQSVAESRSIGLHDLAYTENPDGSWSCVLVGSAIGNHLGSIQSSSSSSSSTPYGGSSDSDDLLSLVSIAPDARISITLK